MPSLLTPNSRSPKSKSPQSNTKTRRSTSPNYFGLIVDPESTTVGSSGSTKLPKEKWTPPTSSIRSAAASSPQPLPLDQNKAYDAFKRRIEDQSFKPGAGSVENSLPTSMHRSTSGEGGFVNNQTSAITQNSTHKTLHMPKAAAIDSTGTDTYKSGSPKRLLSKTDSFALEERSRRGSPPWLQRPESQGSADKEPQFHERLGSEAIPKDPGVREGLHTRAETLPSKLDCEEFEMASPQRVVNIFDSHEEEILVLDLRVSTHYMRSRIRGALNLCIPTTLLKRPSYNVHRLADTFKDERQRFKFENWRGCARIIVYDHSSSQMQEAQGCLNILKKFESEGWTGKSYIISGGFVHFAQKFPAFVESGPGLQDSNFEFLQSTTSAILHRPATPSVAPVIGGCPMPVEKSAANPFFGNIRQNMDLIGGVGQMMVKLPRGASPNFRERLPQWLQIITDEDDQGKQASEKFLQIERREQKRMQEALSGDVSYGTPSVESKRRVQIAGLEKGSKNRYNNIWPFEHTRMRLRGIAKDGCDYINANLIETSVSKRKYVATQAPIPATFFDFWNMVWQNDIRVIVMLTAETEGSQIKAHNYWRNKHYGPLKLTPLIERRASLEPTIIHRHRKRLSSGHQHTSTASEKVRAEVGNSSYSEAEQPYVTVRKFTLSHENEPFARVREITQLQYSNWPDFGAPANPAHLLGLVEQCDAVVRSSTSSVDKQTERPVLVHCSAGCGRTGTFCAVDSVVDALRSQKLYWEGLGVDSNTKSMELSRNQFELDSKTRFVQQSDDLAFGNSKADKGSPARTQRDGIDLVEKTVEELRLQRLSMVQSLRQFVLVYETVLEWLLEQDRVANSPLGH